MCSDNDPEGQSAPERLRELATILARGVIRSRRSAHIAKVSTNPPQDGPVARAAEPSPAGLEVSGETVLSVHTG